MSTDRTTATATRDEALAAARRALRPPRPTTDHVEVHPGDPVGDHCRGHIVSHTTADGISRPICGRCGDSQCLRRAGATYVWAPDSEPYRRNVATKHARRSA